MEVQNFRDRKFIYEHNEEAQRKNETRLKRAMAGAALTVLTVVGLAYQSQKSDQPEKVSLEREDIDSKEMPEGKKIEIDGLEVGSSQEVIDGVFEIDPKERNVRKQPRVVNPSDTGGETNIYKLSGKITVVDPVIVASDVDGTWGMAADSDGSRYYFVLDEDGITNIETGKAFNFNNVETFKAEIVATTNLGSVGKDKSGNNHMVATIVTIKD